MPQFTAISRDTHAGKKWQPFKNYGFASTSALTPIVGVEIEALVKVAPLGRGRGIPCHLATLPRGLQGRHAGSLPFTR